MAIKYIKKGMAVEESAANQEKTRNIVEGILKDVETRGDDAVRELSEKFDKWSPESFRLSDKQIEEIVSSVSEKTLEDIKVVEYHPQQNGKVFFGAWVTLENDDGETLEFRIVGPEEIYGRQDYISIDSPMARACLKKEIDDDVIVKTPNGIKDWFVISIDYKAVDS